MKKKMIKSDDKKLAWKKNVNEHEECNDNNMNNMMIEKEIKANSDERMNNGEGAMSIEIKKENRKETCDQKRNGKVRKRMEDEEGSLKHELKKRKEKERKLKKKCKSVVKKTWKKKPGNFVDCRKIWDVSRWIKNEND